MTLPLSMFTFILQTWTHSYSPANSLLQLLPMTTQDMHALHTRHVSSVSIWGIILMLYESYIPTLQLAVVLCYEHLTSTLRTSALFFFLHKFPCYLQHFPGTLRHLLQYMSNGFPASPVTILRSGSTYNSVLFSTHVYQKQNRLQPNLSWHKTYLKVLYNMFSSKPLINSYTNSAPMLKHLPLILVLH